MRVIVIPAYNEEKTIAEVVRGAAATADRVLVVDDGSSDRTAEAAEAAGASVVRHLLNRGQGAALKTGTLAALAAGADVVVHIDADGQHDPAAVRPLVEPILDGRADVVFGSRFLGISAEGMPASRRLLLWAARQFSILVLGIPSRFTDPQSGLRALTAEAARRVDFSQDRMAHCSEIMRLVSRSPLRAVEIPVKVVYTKESLAKGQKAFDAARIVWQLFLGSWQR
jgi:glycosyltransferase involved in cell wall biosynthesis